MVLLQIDGSTRRRIRRSRTSTVNTKTDLYLMPVAAKVLSKYGQQVWVGCGVAEWIRSTTSVKAMSSAHTVVKVEVSVCLAIGKDGGTALREAMSSLVVSSSH